MIDMVLPNFPYSCVHAYWQLLGFVQSQMTQAMRISSSLHDSSTFYIMKVRDAQHS